MHYCVSVVVSALAILDFWLYKNLPKGGRVWALRTTIYM